MLVAAIAPGDDLAVLSPGGGQATGYRVITGHRAQGTGSSQATRSSQATGHRVQGQVSTGHRAPGHVWWVRNMMAGRGPQACVMSDALMYDV